MGAVNWRDHIVFDPAVLGGKPVLKGTRLAVDLSSAFWLPGGMKLRSARIIQTLRMTVSAQFSPTQRKRSGRSGSTSYPWPKPRHD